MDNKTTSRILASAVTALEHSVVPAVTIDSSSTILDIVIRTLSMLEAHYGRREQDLEQLIKASQALLDEVVTENIKPVATDISMLDRLESEKNIINEHIADKIPALIESSAGNDERAKQSVELLRKIVTTQADFYASQDPNILKGSADVYRGGRIDRPEKVDEVDKFDEITDATLTKYLQYKFPEIPEIFATSVSILLGGFSKTTILFDLHKPDMIVEHCVIRKDLSSDFLMMEKTVIDEYPLLEKVFKAGLNVAEPLWIETNKSWLNGSFIVSRVVAGTSDIGKWIANSSTVSQQLAEILAELHNYDLSTMGFDAELSGLSAGEAIRNEILHWQGLYEKYRSSRHPLLEIGFAWTLNNIPRELFDRAGRIVHGDVGFHNLMVDEGKITALLDWEFGHFGDPAEDLIYVRPFVENIADWDEFVRHYCNAGGKVYSKEVETFYKVWSFVRNASATRHAQYLFENHLPDEIKLALPAWIHGFYLELDASKLVLDILSSK
ncbi:MAG: aminoglycoside phosphotransferase (APT) family kinase protein [Gammaproteobacteria bacterium]|jgi:aminoglycoside phosphotransferase (APT) family kinase protein